MTVEIEFPLEFVVQGTPVSHQTKNRKAIEAWKERVKNASIPMLPIGHFCTESVMSVTLFYFSATEMKGDLDNIIKPIIDALCRHVYMDDKQVERILVQRFEPNKVFRFNAPSAVLANAIEGEKPLLYMRLSDDTTEGLT